jgi:hypothetical protein
MKMSGRSLKGDRFIVHPEVPAIAKLFINVPDTKIWLTNPRLPVSFGGKAQLCCRTIHSFALICYPE